MTCLTVRDVMVLAYDGGEGVKLGEVALGNWGVRNGTDGMTIQL